MCGKNSLYVLRMVCAFKLRSHPCHCSWSAQRARVCVCMCGCVCLDWVCVGRSPFVSEVKGCPPLRVGKEGAAGVTSHMSLEVVH